MAAVRNVSTVSFSLRSPTAVTSEPMRQDHKLRYEKMHIYTAHIKYGKNYEESAQICENISTF